MRGRRLFNLPKLSWLPKPRYIYICKRNYKPTLTPQPHGHENIPQLPSLDPAGLKTISTGTKTTTYRSYLRPSLQTPTNLNPMIAFPKKEMLLNHPRANISLTSTQITYIFYDFRRRINSRRDFLHNWGRTWSQQGRLCSQRLMGRFDSEQLLFGNTVLKTVDHLEIHVRTNSLLLLLYIFRVNC